MVAALDVGFNGLTGTLSTEIGQLSLIQELHIRLLDEAARNDALEARNDALEARLRAVEEALLDTSP